VALTVEKIPEGFTKQKLSEDKDFRKSVIAGLATKLGLTAQQSAQRLRILGIDFEDDLKFKEGNRFSGKFTVRYSVDVEIEITITQDTGDDEADKAAVEAAITVAKAAIKIAVAKIEKLVEGMNDGIASQVMAEVFEVVTKKDLGTLAVVVEEVKIVTPAPTPAPTPSPTPAPTEAPTGSGG